MMFQCDKCNTPIEDLDTGDIFISENHVYCPECTDVFLGKKKRKSGFALWVKDIESDSLQK